jgi:hypothetical protein
MLTRRHFLNAATTVGASAGLGLGPGGNAVAGSAQAPAQAQAGSEGSGGDNGRKTMAIVTTEWRYLSHGQHMGDRFLVGYPSQGSWHAPRLDVVSLYVDQKPEGDLSGQRAEEFGFTVYPSVAEALRRGGDRLAVDAVLVIGEHGRYPRSDYGQVKYPRYEFFKQIVDVFRRDGKTVPVFNDKHLSWNWDWAAEMVATARELKFPFMAGSSLPVTWRMPSVDLPYGAEVDEVVGVAMGGVDSYDFHALEMMQCLVERRKGGETGIAWVHSLRGDAVWAAMEPSQAGWEHGGWSPQLFEACLCRSQTLAQPRPSFNDRHPSPAEIRQLVKDPVAYRFQYRDGLKATMLLMNGLVGDFTVAARLKGNGEGQSQSPSQNQDSAGRGSEVLSTLFYLPPVPNVTYSAELMSRVEQMFLTGQSPHPIDRTLLTTGLLAAAVKSLGTGQTRLETPHLALSYQAPRESLFTQR